MIEKKTLEEIITFKPSDDLNNRVTELLAKEKTVSITEEEKKELDQYMWLEHLMRLAKARARKALQS